MTATVGADADLLERRSAAVAALNASLEIRDLKELVHMAFGHGQPQGELYGRFVEAVRSSDPTFVGKEGAYELAVLSGICAHELMKEPGPKGDVVAQAILNYSFDGRFPPDSLPVLIDKSRECLSARSVEVRRPLAVKLARLPSEETITNRLQRLDAGIAANSVAELGAPLKTYLEELSGDVRDELSSFRRAISVLHSIAKVQNEESNIYWWVFSAYSNDLDSPLADLGYSTACLLAGKELADLVTAFPGPRSAKSFLQLAVKKDRKKAELRAATSIKDAVNSLDKTWREERQASHKLADVDAICPILLAINKSLETENQDDWASVFEKASGVDAETEFQGVELGFQLYTEVILMRFLARDR